MAVKSKSKQSAKVGPFMLLKKKNVKVEDEDDMLDSEVEEDDELMDLEDDESIAPDEDDSDDEEMEEKQSPKSAKQPKKSQAPKEKQAKTPPGKQTNGTKNGTPALNLKSKCSLTERLERTVVVKHLKATHTDNDVSKFFASVGKCTLAKRVLSKGLAMVLLDNVMLVEKALALSGKTLNGHPLVVERSKFVGMDEKLKEKKKLRTKKQKLARRMKAKQESAGTERPEKKVVTGKGQKDKKEQSKQQEGKPNKKVVKPTSAQKGKPVKKVSSNANGGGKKKMVKPAK